MTYDKKIGNNSESVVEPIDVLLRRPVDELAAFIGGDLDVFRTLVSEVERLELLDEDKSKILEKLSEAAVISKVSFPNIEEVSTTE